MSEGIRPALTAEEWARVLAGELCDENEALLPGDPFDDEDRGKRLSDAGLAAALLQMAGPKGTPWFTWEDVDLLRDFVVMDGGAPSGRFAHTDIADLADRIAALLPPRETKP